MQEATEVKENDTQEAEELMMNEVVFLNEKNVKPTELQTSEDNVWYLDNGASNHMTGDRRYFKSINEAITGKVRFGDDSRIDIKGKGPIIFCTKDRVKKILADVYYIPDLKSNIISLGQATEAGCDIRMKDDYLTLRDKEGKLITRAKRSRNRLYKVTIDFADTLCLQASTTLSNSAKWHARLGHIGKESMSRMIKKDMVDGIPNLTVEKDTCSSCILGKQARLSFPQATTFRVEQLRFVPLRHIHCQERDIYLFLSMIILDICGQFFLEKRGKHLKNLRDSKPLLSKRLERL